MSLFLCSAVPIAGRFAFYAEVPPVIQFLLSNPGDKNLHGVNPAFDCQNTLGSGRLDIHPAMMRSETVGDDHIGREHFRRGNKRTIITDGSLFNTHG